MRRCVLSLALGILAAMPSGSSFAQGQPRGPNIAFRNDTKTAVIVQGATEVKGMQRRGQPLLVQPGKTVYDTNLPAGDRFVTIYDANQTNKVLHRDRIPVRNADLQLVIRQIQPNPPRFAIVPDTNP
jgi:hypothetical protein